VSTILESILYFILAFFPVVLIHEAGHMLAAKLLGIEVKRFSVGFGKRLFGARRGETDYCVSMIPLGGYVRLAGDDQPGPLKEQRHHLLAHPRLHRLLVYVAGPLANLILALIIYCGVYWAGFEELYYEPVIGQVVEELPEGQASPAAAAGLRPGDRILTLDGEPVESWNELTQGVIMNSGGEFSLTVERGGEELTLTVTPYSNPELGYGQIGVGPRIDTVITRLTDEAAATGLRPGDRIVAFNGSEIDELGDLQHALAAAVEDGAEEVELTVRGDDGVRELTAPPALFSNGEQVIIGGSVRRIEPGLLAGVGLAADETYAQLENTYGGLELMITGALGVKENLASVISIAYVSGRIAQQGLTAFLRFVAGLSVILAIFNLLPIFPLDGGHLALLLTEMIRRRPVPPLVQRGFAYLGILLIGGLFILAVYSDISRLFF
jgi:regulator of sigma E protease